MNISDIFIVIIISFITVIIAGFFIFIQSEVGTEMENAFEELTASNERGINYSESYEVGFAEELKNKYLQLERKLQPWEVDELFGKFELKRICELLVFWANNLQIRSMSFSSRLVILTPK